MENKSKNKRLTKPHSSTAAWYDTGTMPTSNGFTGQRLDPSGLQYFNARYYDSVVGQFTSADSVQGPNRYEYVGGNPETITDPTGQFGACAGSMPDGRCTHPRPSPKPTPTPTTTQNPLGCGNLTPQQCQDAKNNQRNNVSFWQTIIKLLNAGLSVFSLVVTIQQLLQDLNGGVDQVLNIISDILNGFADVLNVASSVLAIVGQFGADTRGVQKVIDLISGGLKAFSAGYNAFRSAPGFLIQVAKYIFFGVVQTFKLVTDGAGDLVPALWALVKIAISRLNPNFVRKFLVQAGVDVINSAISLVSAHMECIADESPYQYSVGSPGCTVFI